jgi:uncharacterized protein YndB with AHSA1/START domain
VTTRRITLERVYQADIQDVWDLWTTKEGIESWWGPGGFSVAVRKLDLRPGGEMHYAMMAVDPPQVEFMKKAGMPLTQECRITFTEVTPPRRLAYINLVDFIAGVDQYNVATIVDLEQKGGSVRMRLSLDPMHNDEWTQRAVMGWNSEIDKLGALIGSRTANPQP